ncbi:hypothetical protein SISSUDRAFT_1006597 [Sistotremastrum suecicum HHB10207 ss-3]|uniref:BAG domain-containing protein n=1 Tax=Sistotremastrum suecicum HHB10207 ss-3 TaxID=1314776 RepID=A0A166C748_9AGAM|nr:hypothetical protein SISSUDRAFT_1006597 [Sistotremastrum suecicum HHB10207 ss-3]
MKLLSKLDAVESDGDENIRTTRKEIARLVEAALQGLDAEKEEMWKRQRRETSTAPAPVTGYEISDNTAEVSESVAVTTSIPIAGPGESTPVVSETLQEIVSAPSEQTRTPELDAPAADPDPAVLVSETPSTSSSVSSHDQPTAVETSGVPNASITAKVDEAQPQVAPQTDESSAAVSPAFLDNLPSSESAPQILSPPVLNDSPASPSADTEKATSDQAVPAPEVNLTSSADEVIDYSSDVSDTQSVSSVSSAATRESLEVANHSSDAEDFEVVD